MVRTCRGKGSTYSNVRETINIPKGVDSNVNLRVSKKGNYSPTGPPGDLLINIKVRADPYFKRDGFDIHTEYYLSVAQVDILKVKCKYRLFWEQR